MTDEDRLSALENTVRNFKLIVNGTDQIQGGFGPLKSYDTLEDRLSQIQNAISKFSIVGGAGINIEGSFDNGYSISATCPGTSASGTGPPPPPPATGACCLQNGSCIISNQNTCISLGGTYRGDDTTCDPNPCPSGGVCDNVIQNIQGIITANADETCGVHKVVSISGMFNRPYDGMFFYITGAYNETCDGTPATYNLYTEIFIECRFGHPNPDDNGWFIHLFIDGPSTCCGQTSFALNSGAFTKYAENTDPGTGVFHFDLDLLGGSAFGTGSGAIDITIN